MNYFIYLESFEPIIAAVGLSRRSLAAAAHRPDATNGIPDAADRLDAAADHPEAANGPPDATDRRRTPQAPADAAATPPDAAATY